LRAVADALRDAVVRPDLFRDIRQLLVAQVRAAVLPRLRALLEQGAVELREQFTVSGLGDAQRRPGRAGRVVAAGRRAVEEVEHVITDSEVTVVDRLVD